MREQAAPPGGRAPHGRETAPLPGAPQAHPPAPDAPGPFAPPPPWSTRVQAVATRVAVQVGSDHAGSPGTIAGWLRAGRHRGLLLDGRLRVGRPA